MPERAVELLPWATAQPELGQQRYGCSHAELRECWTADPETGRGRLAALEGERLVLAETAQGQ